VGEIREEVLAAVAVVAAVAAQVEVIQEVEEDLAEPDNHTDSNSFSGYL
jgi:hypothetical protein